MTTLTESNPIARLKLHELIDLYADYLTRSDAGQAANAGGNAETAAFGVALRISVALGRTLETKAAKQYSRTRQQSLQQPHADLSGWTEGYEAALALS
jgi:hypothetical protein